MSYTGYDASLTEKAKSNLKAAFAKDEKGFSARLNVSPNGKSSKVENEFRKVLSCLFKQHHCDGHVVKNSNVEIVLHSFDTMFDFTKTHLSSHFFRNLLDEIGLKHSGIRIRHHADKEPFIEVFVSFKEVLPIELYRTEDSLNDE